MAACMKHYQGVTEDLLGCSVTLDSVTKPSHLNRWYNTPNINVFWKYSTKTDTFPNMDNLLKYAKLQLSH